MVHVKESEDVLEDWVEEKLEEGVERQRLKKILDERDRDPEVVDKVASPFDAGDSEKDGKEETKVVEEESSDSEDSSNFMSKFLN